MKKILVIENDNDTLDLIAYILTDMGFEVVALKHQISIEEVIKINPVLVLTDHWVTNGFGGDLCKQMKASPLTKNIPVILFSAATDIEKISKDCQADLFIAKPFDLAEIEQKVQTLVSA